VQKLRREVRAIRPYDSVKLGMQLEGSQQRDVPQGLEDWAIELATKVYVAFETVVEAEVDD
jgi:hypothetical protein